MCQSSPVCPPPPAGTWAGWFWEIFFVRMWGKFTLKILKIIVEWESSVLLSTFPLPGASGIYRIGQKIFVVIRPYEPWVAVFFQHASGLQHVFGFCSMSFFRLRALQCDLQHWGCTAPFAIAFKRKKAFNESSNHRSSRQGSFVIDQEHKFGDPRQSDTAHDNQTQSWTIKYNPSPHTVLFRSTLLTFTCSATCLWTSYPH